MFIFCPLCGNTLFLENRSGQNYFVCNVCPLNCKQTRTITHRVYLKLKNIDDVLGGEEAWKNVNSTDCTCPKCGHPQAYFLQLQIRSADEPMTTFYRCCSPQCHHCWRD